MQPAASRGARALESLVLATCGALQTLAFVHTAAWAVPLLTTALLAWRLDRSSSPLRAAWLGWVYGCAWLCAGTWWLFISMHRYGHLPGWMAAVAVLALAAALSLYLGLASALYRRWRSGGAGDALLFACLWLLAELARGVLFTGFPWIASGYAQVDSPLAALAPWVGVYGIGAVAAALSAALAQAVSGLAGIATAIAAVAGLGGAAWFGPGEHSLAGGRLTVQLLQPNVAQDVKFASKRMPATLQWVATRLLASRADLVVAPETAVPLLPSDLELVAPGYWNTLREHFSSGTRAALVGVPLGDAERGYTNSVAGLAAAGEYRYDKQHLVPFGEFIPTGFRWFTELMRIPLGDFNRGVLAAPSFALPGGERAAPNICYEDLFGEELALRFADPLRAPTLFVNLSNIGWFGDTIAVDQHLGVARMRSLEFQRPTVRATNTGATVVIDHHGRVAAMLPPFTAGVLDATVEGRQGLTPFARWSAAAGLWPPLLLALALCAVLVQPWRRRRRRPSRHEPGP